MVYSSEEKETSCLYDYINEQWNVYSSVPVHIRKLIKIAKPYWEEREGKRIIAAKWSLNSNQVRFAMATVAKMSDELKKAAKLRMQSQHRNRKDIITK